jgi:CheY-like chemotaxis protein
MANRILLADDSITIQKVVNLTFADEGIEVVAVSNGDQAERRLADVQPDLVLADIFMPGKNGYELCEAIKESGQFHHIPVVLLVGAFEPFDQAEARRVKADAHLTKPFESRTLVDTVRKLMNASGQPRTGPLPPLPAPDAKAEPHTVTPLTPSMASHVAPPAPPQMTTPLNFNYGSNEDPLAVPLEVQVGNASAGQTAFAPQSHVLGRTDDLSFADSQPPFEPLGLDELFNEPATGFDAHSAVAPESSLSEANRQESGFAVPSTFGYATEEMLLDLEQPTQPVMRAEPEPFAFDLDARETASIDASGIQPEASNDESAAEHVAMPTTLLEAPPPTAPVDVAVNTNPLAMPAAESVIESDAAVATPTVDPSVLFNVDDPLGDVLDEGAVAATVEAAPAAPFEPASAAALNAPLAEVATTETMEPQAAAVSDQLPMDYAVEFPAEPLAIAPEPLPEAMTDAAFEMNASEVEPRAATETGFGFMPVEADTVEATPRANDTGFTTASMWTNEDARFAAIDIEATPVEEPVESVADEAPVEMTTAHVEEEDAAAYTTQAERPAAPVEAAMAAPVEATTDAPSVAETVEETTATAPPAQETQAPAAAAGVELSPALVDEIVRRVVAQMSESVVREIAWEIVPDCVERVIKEMTAHEVAKH